MECEVNSSGVVIFFATLDLEKILIYGWTLD